MRVPMAVHIATKPVKGKSPQGCSFKHGDARFSNASGKTWMKPVARITPAARAFIKTKIFFSGLKAGITLPRRGIQTPIPLPIKIDSKAIILYFKDLAVLLSSFSPSHSAATIGTTIKKTRIKEENK